MYLNAKTWTKYTFMQPSRDHEVSCPDIEDTRASVDVLADLIDEYGPVSNLSESEIHRLGLDALAVDE